MPRHAGPQLPIWGLLAAWAVFGTFTFLFGRALHWGLPVDWNARASREWPATTAEILSSTVIEQRRTVFEAAVTYRYHVEGREFSGDRIRFGWEGESTREGQQAVSARFPVGARVPVHYHPADPAVSTLLPGQGDHGSLGLWIGAVLFLLSAVSLAAVTVAFASGRLR